MASHASAAGFAAPVQPATISAGRVFERALTTVRHNPAATIGLAVLLCAIPGVTFQILLGRVEPAALVMTVAGYALPGAFALFLLQWFASHVVGSITQGAMVAPVLADDAGRRAGFGESLAAALRSLLPLIGLGALLGLGVEIGTTLLIVPGVIIYLMWAVAPSALAAERDGLFLALNRSQELTEGARWKVFGITLVLEIFNIALSMGVAWSASRFLGVNLRLAQFSAGYVISMGLLSILVNLLWSTVQASLYVELVRWKEGGSTETLAEVFA
jgi:hypothetical protein